MLKMKLSTLDGLSDAEKAHYKQSGDEYVLELDINPKTEEDVRNLKIALDKERADHKDVKAKLSAYKHSPEDIDKLINETEELRIRAGKIDEKSISELVAVRLKPFEREKETLISKLNQTEEEKNRALNQLRDHSLETELRSVAESLIDPLSMQDAILRAKTVISWNEEKQGFFDRDGADVKSWIENTLPKTNWGIKNFGGGSKGKDTGAKTTIQIGEEVFSAENNPFASETFNLTKQSLIAKTNPEFAQVLSAMIKK